MSTRQAMVAVMEAFNGPWQVARGHETGILINGLGEGECVEMELDDGVQLEIPLIYHHNGHFPFPKCSRFRFNKTKGGVKETFVEVVL